MTSNRIISAFSWTPVRAGGGGGWPALLRTLVGAGLVLCSTAGASAQTEELPPPPQGYTSAVPDIAQSVEETTSLKHKWVNIHFGLAPIYDYTWLTQDENSIQQVGVQNDQGEWRSGRIQARGTLFNQLERPWKFLVSFEYRGFDSDPDVTWTWTDVSLTVPVGPLGDLTMGKIKEPFAYEMVGDAANLPHLERLLSPFFTSRNVGLRLDKTLFGERATAALGAYNDWFVKDLDYGDSGWDVAGRITGVPVWANDGRRFLHLGGAWRYVGADDGLLRYRGRPESNVTDYYIDATFEDAKGIPASHANHWAAELLWNEGPVSVLAEYAGARLSSREASDPRFSGWYVVGSWVLTGEHRPYDRKVGYARRVLPRHRWGALEVVARYGQVGAVDTSIDGGALDKWFTAANWWATRRWRFSLGYGVATLDRGGLTGETRQTIVRTQWIF